MTNAQRIKNFPWVMLAIYILGALLFIFGLSRESLWYDESYSAAIVNHPIGEIIRITGGDSHPPLYYVMLRLFRLVFGNSVFILRFVSVLGAFALASLGLGPVRRTLGDRVAVFYTALIFLVPIMLAMAQEMRMYTWSAFWVTGSALYGYLSTTHRKTKDMIRFGLYTLAAAYTHYYALLAVVMICSLLLIWHLVEKKKLFPFLWVACGVAVGYLPWLNQLAKQVSRVSKNFWIQPVSSKLVWSVLCYPFGDKFQTSWAFLLASPGFLIASFLIVNGILKNIAKDDKTFKLPLLAIGAYLLTLLAGVVASIVIRPVLVERYIVPVLGLFFLGIAYGLASFTTRKPLLFACGLLLLVSVPQLYLVHTARFNGPMNEIAAALGPQLQQGDIVLHTDEHTFGTFSYYFPNNQQYYYQRKGYEGFSNYDAFLPNGHTILTLDALKGSKRIWLAQRIYAPDSLTAESWFSSGALVLQDTPVTYQLPQSWYGIVLYQTTLGPSD